MQLWPSLLISFSVEPVAVKDGTRTQNVLLYLLHIRKHISYIQRLLRRLVIIHSNRVEVEVERSGPEPEEPSRARERAKSTFNICCSIPFLILSSFSALLGLSLSLSRRHAT